MTESAPFAAVVLAAFAGIVLLVRSRRSRARRMGLRVASELEPEIRSLMQECDRAADAPKQRQSNVFEQHRAELHRLFSKELVFAIETFYGCFEAHREAAQTMRQLFDPHEQHTLGDRIRAKDRSDRLLKDVYFSGEAALEKLGELRPWDSART